MFSISQNSLDTPTQFKKVAEDLRRVEEESCNELTLAFILLPPYLNNIGFIVPQI